MNAFEHLLDRGKMSDKCPFQSNSDLPDPKDMYYQQYLQLDKVLGAQLRASPVHDEMLFIIIHQVHELWFKQVIFEIDSIRDIFKCDVMEEKNTLIIVQRLNRIVMILKSVTDLFPILESMSPQSFMSFRDHLFPASGFQSRQFRELEIKLGLEPNDRVGKSTEIISSMLREEERNFLATISKEEPLSLLVQKWLERTPGFEEDNFSFIQSYKQAVDTLLKSKQDSLDKETDERLRKQFETSIEQTKNIFQDIFDIEAYNENYKSRQRKFTHKALMAALMIHVYREIPRFSEPFQILTLLTDIDNQITKWRYAHSQMVQRMIGSRIGTGNSMGYYYLKSTVSDHYKTFVDLSSLGAYLLPEKFVPSLPPELEKKIASQNSA